MWINDSEGNRMVSRRVTIVLDEPTRHSETEIHLLTNLPKKVKAIKVANLYRKRWTIESAFGELAAVLNNEIDTLGYPGAALLGFCLGLLTYNMLSVMKAALRSIHGEQVVAEEVSTYHIAVEIRCTWGGMLLILPPEYWSQRFGAMSVAALAKELRRLAKLVRLRQIQKSKRGPKKPQPERTSAKARPHVSTARLLAQRQGA